MKAGLVIISFLGPGDEDEEDDGGSELSDFEDAIEDDLLGGTEAD